MSVRIKLSQRYGREFPPRNTYAEAAAAAKSEDQFLNKKQIMRSLIGQSLDSWHFDSMKEFISLRIVSVKNPNDVRADYEVQTHVKGIPSGEEHDFKLRLTYGWLYTRWVLVKIQELN
jgi:hypothetical protein